MDTKGIWLDVSLSDSEQPDIIPTLAIEYHASKRLPIVEFNEREATYNMDVGVSAEPVEEPLFGTSIREAIRILRE